MKITFASIHIEDSPRSVPLGAVMVASYIKKQLKEQVDIAILDFFLEDEAEKIIEKIIKEKSEYIGFSMYVWNRNRILEIADAVKKLNPERILFLGGPEATADYERLAENKAIDFIVRGEGEELTVKAFEYLLNEKDISKLGEHVMSPIVPNLDNLESPYLDGTLNPDNYKGILWELSRGCPFKCDFCFESRGTAGVRRFPLQRIQSELELFHARGVEQIFILDPTFNYNIKAAKKMLQMMIATAPEIHYFMEIRGEFIDEEIAGLFASLYCSLQIGLQSSDNEVLKNINRTIDLESFEANILHLHEAEVTYGFDLIYGLPGDTLEGFKQSLDFALSLIPNQLDIFPLSVLPGTALWDTASGHKLKHLKDNPYTVISSPGFTEKDMKAAKNLADACDLFYNQGKAVPWFFIIINELGITPSEFFLEFNSFLQETNINGDDIIGLQREFLTLIFTERKNIKSGQLASDIAAYFSHFAFLLEHEKTPSENTSGLYILNHESSIVHFHHSPGELIELVFSGVTDFDELAEMVRDNAHDALFFNNNGEIEIRLFSDSEIKFLQQAEKGLESAPGDNEMKEFFDYCLSERIIVKEV